MGRQSFRFIHASDFHLENPLRGLTEIPDHLRQVLIDAPWRAAEAVFEHAVIEDVDFIVLAGDIVDPLTSGARGIAFLREQFEILRERNIEVFWCCGKADALERWPAGLEFPSNVHRFRSDAVEARRFSSQGEIVATLLGRSASGRDTVHPAEYRFEPDGSFCIAVAYGEAETETLTTESVDYWALGGRHQLEILQTEEPAVCYCGAPQARRLAEEGAHGFFLVDVDAQHRQRIRTVEVDLVRYTEQDIDVEENIDLKAACGKRISRLISESNGRHLLVQWRLRLNENMTHGLASLNAGQLLHWLRHEYGRTQPACWSLGIDILPPRKFPDSWYGEDTILGDFLRIAEKARKKQTTIELRSVLDSETDDAKPWYALLGDKVDARSPVFAQATLTGAELLRGRKIDLLAGAQHFGEPEE